MAKFVVFLVACFAFQAVFAGIPRWHQVPDVSEIGKYTHDLTRALKTNYDVEQLLFFKDRVEKLVDVLETKHSGDETILELKNKLHDLLVDLQNPMQMSRRLIDDLDDVWKIFNSVSEQLRNGERPIEVHYVLVELADDYCQALKRTCSMLTKPTTMNRLNSKDEVERALMDVLKNLNTVSFDNLVDRRLVVDLIHNYLQMLPEVLKGQVDCFNMIMDKDFDPMALKKCFEKLSMIVKNRHLEESVYARLLPATRTLEFNLYNMCHTKIPLGETPFGFQVQLQIVANGLINAINTISVENEEAQSILIDLVREFVSEIEGINGKLKMLHVIGGMDVAIDDLKHVETMDVDGIKMRLMNAVQKSTMEIGAILRHKLTDDVYGIVSDFLAVLQRQTMQVQNIYQSITDKLPIDKLAMQVQTITNGVLIYLRNVPTNDVMIREKLEVQVHHLIKRLQGALQRIHSIDDEDFTQTIRKIKDVTDEFENFMGKTHMSSIPEVVFHFDILAQKIASGMKQLAWIATSKNVHTDVVRSLLSEYLVIIENIQVKIQRINQVAQVGESPRELALQIEVISEHLRKLLMVFTTDNNRTKNVLMWQVRCLNQILEVIIEQLQTKMISETGTIYRKVAMNLKNIQQSLKIYLDPSKTVQMDHFRIAIGNIIRNASMELNKLTTTSHSDIQEGQGAQTTFVRSILMEFLLGLQDFHMQIQHNFQIVLSGQSPMQILREIGVLSNQILAILDGSDVRMEEVLAIQLGEYVQTIENVLNLLHHRMKNNGEHQVEQEKISDVLGKMSLILQNVNVKNTAEVREKLEMSMRKFMTVMQELVAMNMEKVKLMQVGTHTGILHGALSNMLGTMRNMYVQMNYVKRMPKYENTNEILNHIASINNNIMPALETIVGSTTPIKQALDLQVFKYARELTLLVKKLDAVADPKIKIDIQEALMVLEQTASSMATLTINEIKLHLNKLVQGVGNEMQKVNNREILVEYLRSLKNLHLQIQSISRMSHQSENYQLVGMFIDSAIVELCKSLQKVPSRNKLVAKAIVLESQELAQIIANVINRYQAASVLQKNKIFMKIASELKTVQLRLQELTVRKVYEEFDETNVEVVSDVEKAAVLIEELMWMPVAQTSTAQYRPDMPTFVRVTLHDFLTAVQNMVIQIESVLVRVTDDKLALIDKLSHNQVVMKPTQHNPEMELYQRMMNSDSHTVVKHDAMRTHRTEVSDLLVTMMMDSYKDLKNGVLDKDAIKKYVKHLLVLVEEIMELMPSNFETKIFVQRMHSVYTVLRRISMDNVFARTEFLESVHSIISACEEFYQKLTGSGDKHLLVLVKSWMGEFCSVLQHGHKAVGGAEVLHSIKVLTEKVIYELRGKDDYRVGGYARKYFKMLHSILDTVPASLVGELGSVHLGGEESMKRHFISILEMVPRTFERITATEERGGAMLTRNLLMPYLDCLEKMYSELRSYPIRHY